MSQSEQYLLKRWYPKLPKSWKFYQNDVIVTKRGEHYIGDMTTLSIDEVENNPEFWKPIEERKYEILKVKGKVSNRIKGWIEDDSGFTLDFHTIYSVKRLSDNEIFTVGDKVEHGYCVHGEERRLKWEIHSIVRKDGKLKLFSGTGFYRKIDEIIKQKQAVFTSKEGAKKQINDNKFKYSKVDIKNALERALKHQIILIENGSIHNFNFDKETFWNSLNEETNS